MVPTTSSSCSRRSMEDVWTDISLSYLSHNSCNTTTTAADDPAAAAFQGIIFQDFLACTSTISSNIDPPQPAAASTVLSLNSGTRSDLEQHLLETTRTTITDPRPLKPNPKLNPPELVALDDHDQNHHDHHNSTNGGRHKRMIKNRESAARSIARKQEPFCPCISLPIMCSYISTSSYLASPTLVQQLLPKNVGLLDRQLPLDQLRQPQTA
ncbi:hypothetical protein EV1_042014 [Malus domestica]